MPYVTINLTNDYDTANKIRHATQEETDGRAREILSQFPDARVYIAQVLKEYTAEVSITAKNPAEPKHADETDTAA